MADTKSPMDTRAFLDEDGVNALSTRIFEKVNERLNNINDNENTLSNLAIKFLAIEALMDVAKEHAADTNNPHNVTKAQLGLEKVENKSAADILGELQVVSDSITGLMTPAMLQKLNNIPEAAMGLAVDTALSTSSENPVQNKVIASALNNKADLNPTFTEAATLAGIQSGDSMITILGQMAKAITTLQDAITRLSTAEGNVTTLQTKTETMQTQITQVDNKVETEVQTAVTNINQSITNLNQAVEDVAVYDMIQQETSEDGYFSTYTLTKDGTPIGSKINIPKDYLVKGVSVKVVTTTDTPYSGAVVGDKYVDWVINTQQGTGNEQHLYIPVKELMNPLSAANAAITITADNAIGLKIVASNGLSIGANGLQLVAASETNAGAMTPEMVQKLYAANIDESGKVEQAKQADTATTAETAKTAETADTAAQADEATKLAQPAEIAISGVTEGSASFDGSSNVTINLTDLTIPVVNEDPATPKEGQVWIRG